MLDSSARQYIVRPNMYRTLLRDLCFLSLLSMVCLVPACKKPQRSGIVIGSKFFTEQVILAELLAQRIEARTGIPVERKTNLGGTLLVHKALLAGQIDLYVEYTGTALTAVLNEPPDRSSSAAGKGVADPVYQRVKQLYAQRFNLEVTEPLGFENTFAMVIRGEDANNFHVRTISDIVRYAPRWRVGVGYEFLERPDGFHGWTDFYHLQFAETPRVMDLGLIYRVLVDRQVDLVAGNSTDGLIDALNLVALEDDRHYFPRYDAVPIIRKSTLDRFPQLGAVLSELGGKISESDIRKMNYAVDVTHRDAAVVVREFRATKGW
ncbi:MAG TPA: glycine betaine ABC transporter substrate-binding protein [Candidatus Acidoferrum sp.]|nr:glycine betaine ABC transporter substrate-binding protein [Candidatus Acidoferrum sp.]